MAIKKINGHSVTTTVPSSADSANVSGVTVPVTREPKHTGK